MQVRVCMCVLEYLQQVGSDASVSTLLGHLFGQPGDLIRGFGNVFSTLDHSPLITAAATYQPGHLSHQQRHPLGRRNDVISLWRKGEGCDGGDWGEGQWERGS